LRQGLRRVGGDKGRGFDRHRATEASGETAPCRSDQDDAAEDPRPAPAPCVLGSARRNAADFQFIEIGHASGECAAGGKTRLQGANYTYSGPRFRSISPLAEKKILPGVGRENEKRLKSKLAELCKLIAAEKSSRRESLLLRKLSRHGACGRELPAERRYRQEPSAIFSCIGQT